MFGPMTYYLLPLALGFFVVGTESLMIAGLLPAIARSFDISMSLAGQLVSAFALSYAIGSPFVAVMTSRLESKTVLISTMGAFGLGTLIASQATTFSELALVRVFLALCAGVFSPTALSYAASLVDTKIKGRALSFVSSGFFFALVMGVPLGTLLGEKLSWRLAYQGIACVSFLALLGIVCFLPRGGNSSVIGLRDRILLVTQRKFLSVLVVTVLVPIGYWVIYPFTIPLLAKMGQLQGSAIPIFLFAYGLSALAGNYLGGYAADKWSVRNFLLIATALLTTLYVAMSLVANAVVPAGLPGTVGIFMVWGLVVWAIPVVQQYRLASLAGPLAPIAMALNQSAVQLAIATGAGIGTFVSHYRTVGDLGWAAAICGFLCFIWMAIRGDESKSRDSERSDGNLFAIKFGAKAQASRPGTSN